MGTQVKLFKDIESNEIITSEQLYNEYMESDNSDGLLFSEFVFNCLTRNGGTLEEINTTKHYNYSNERGK